MDITALFPEPTPQDRQLAPPSFWRRWRVPLAITAALAVLAALLVPSLLRVTGIRSSVSLARVVISEVRRGPFVRDFATDGRVVAANSPVLYAPAAGGVKLLAKPGDAVKKNQVLAIVESPDLDARLQVERAGLDVLRSELQRARLESTRLSAESRQLYEQAQVDFHTVEREYERSRRAFEFGAYSRLQVERAQDAMQKARFALEHARRNMEARPLQGRFDVQSREAALRRQQVLVDDLARQVEALQLRSPVHGRVGQMQVADRAVVPRDAPLLSVVDLSQLEVEIDVPESFARDLVPGVAAELSGNGGRWTGNVSGVSPEVVNGQVVARVRFTGAEPQGLRQSQRLSVRVLIEQRDDVLTVERGGLTDQGGYAYRVAGGIATRTPVRLGSASIGRVEVLEGLAMGDKVVVSGMDAFDNAERIILSN